MLLNGVRSAAIARSRSYLEGGMGKVMALSLREEMHLVSDPRNLDSSVEEVFGLMLGVHCQRVDGTKLIGGESESVTAVVGFGGLLSGACVFKCGAIAAMQIAATMTGMEFATVDETVQDGIGEICNMLAGAWKSNVPKLAANCGLSVPAVITGRDYNLRVQAPEFLLHHDYVFESAHFEVTIVCDALQ